MAHAATARPDALIAAVHDGLAASLATAQEAGIARDQIVLDPGYGFGKRFSENYVLLNRQAELLTLGRPLLAGLSRKSFLGHTLAPLFDGSDAPLDARENASLAAMTAAILHGASIVRVHQVRPAVEAARIATPFWPAVRQCRMRPPPRSSRQASFFFTSRSCANESALSLPVRSMSTLKVTGTFTLLHALT